MTEKRGGALPETGPGPALLLAAFSAFPGAPRNPAELLAQGFDAATLRQPVRLRKAILPVEWDRSWERLEAAIRAARADAVVLFGVNGRARRLQLERRAINERLVDRVDASGAVASGSRVCAGPCHLFARLPLHAIAADLRAAAIDCELSEDAGRYLCNETFFQLCRAAPAHGLSRYGFVHVPHTQDTAAAAGLAPALDAGTLATAAAIILDRVALDLAQQATLDASRVGDGSGQGSGEPYSAAADDRAGTIRRLPS